MSENTPEQDQQIHAADAGDKQTDDAPSAEPVDTEAVKQIAGRIKIGSRKDINEDKLRPVDMSQSVPGPEVVGPVPTPSVGDELSDDLEQEIAAALGDASLDDLISDDATKLASTDIESKQRRRATVIRLDGENVFFALGGPNEGVVSIRQFVEPPEVGTDMDVIVREMNTEDGLYEVAIPGAAVEVGDWGDLQEGAVIEVHVTGHNVGGLECEVNSIRGFIPISQVALYRVENLEEYQSKKLMCVVTEADPQKRNLVLSHRAILEREKVEQRAERMNQIQVGEICEGTVRSVKDFGAFVDIGGLDGLIHISQMSWDRVNHPSEVVSEGDKVKVRIEKINPQDGRIGLSLRALQDHPWTGIDSQFHVSDVVKGTVSRIAQFGAFVKLAPGVEGLVHISELAHHRVSMVSSVVSEGEEVDVKILSVDTEAQRISLSIKQTVSAPEVDTSSNDEGVDEPARKVSIKPSGKPLEGGINRPSGGEQFGLKW